MPEAARSFSILSRPSSLLRINDLMATAFRGAEIDKFIDVVHDAGLAHNLQRDETATERAYSETVWACIAVHVIGRFPSTATVHELQKDRGVAWDVFAQKGNQRSNAEISRATRCASDDHFHRFSLIERSLPERRKRCDRQYSNSRRHKRQYEVIESGRNTHRHRCRLRRQ